MFTFIHYLLDYKPTHFPCNYTGNLGLVSFFNLTNILILTQSYYQVTAM